MMQPGDEIQVRTTTEARALQAIGKAEYITAEVERGSTEIPVRRGRGRPRKNPLPTSAAGSAAGRAMAPPEPQPQPQHPASEPEPAEPEPAGSPPSTEAVTENA